MKPQPRTIRLPQEMWDRLDEAAQENLRTVNGMVHVALEEWLDDWYPVRDGHPEPPYGVVCDQRGHVTGVHSDG